MTKIFIIGFLSCSAYLQSCALAHGRSEEMLNELNSPTPEWMNLVTPIKVEIAKDSDIQNLNFRKVNEGVIYTRNRISIPDKNIVCEVDYPISRFKGSSMSPDGKKLIVNSGTNTYLYKITDKGELLKVDSKIPYITYDEGDKGFITGWSWAGNDILIGRASITDESGHIDLEYRLYAYYLESQSLARIDLSPGLRKDEVPEIISIGEDFNHIRILAGDRELTIKANLKSATKPFSGDFKTSQADTSNPSILWLVIVPILVISVVLGIIVVKRKRN